MCCEFLCFCEHDNTQYNFCSLQTLSLSSILLQRLPKLIFYNWDNWPKIRKRTLLPIFQSKISSITSISIYFFLHFLDLNFPVHHKNVNMRPLFRNAKEMKINNFSIASLKSPFYTFEKHPLHPRPYCMAAIWNFRKIVANWWLQKGLLKSDYICILYDFFFEKFLKT
jgi:hypothetical protein